MPTATTKADPILARAKVAAKFFSYVASESRVAILLILAEGDMNPTDIADRLGKSLQTVIACSSPLRHAGIVDSIRDGTRKPYSLTPFGRKLIAAIEAIEAREVRP